MRSFWFGCPFASSRRRGPLSFACYNAAMRFVKMHGAGNDYVYVNGYAQTVHNPVALATQISNRHFGVGSDGLILLLPPETGVDADVRMRMFNADGSEAEMCGNGIRCLAKLAHDHGVCDAKPMRVQTGAGVLSINYALDNQGKLTTATVDMGEPIFDLPAVPVDASKLDEQITDATFVSMGNPHAVFFLDEDQPIINPTLGAQLEVHAAFPNRMNIHFVHVNSPSEVTVYHWERGSGATLACGTGACAVCVAGVLTGKTERNITAHLPGGDLQLEWREADNHVYMTGPAAEVFTGDWPE